MRRELAAALLLGALLLTARLGQRETDRLTGSVCRTLDAAEQCAEAGDYPAALALLDEAMASWQRGHTHAAMFLRQPDLDDTAEAFYDLQELLQRQEDARAAFALLRYRLETLTRMEHLSWGTVF